MRRQYSRILDILSLYPRHPPIFRTCEYDLMKGCSAQLSVC